jgi:hypothetical protein
MEQHPGLEEANKKCCDNSNSNYPERRLAWNNEARFDERGIGSRLEFQSLNTLR